MRVRGPIPRERIKIGKAVQDGMRAMFRSAHVQQNNTVEPSSSSEEPQYSRDPSMAENADVSPHSGIPLGPEQVKVCSHCCCGLS